MHQPHSDGGTHMNCSISSSKYGFPCRFHHREECTELHSSCYIGLLWIWIMFFCFWETNLCLGYSQNPISEPLKLKPHFWVGTPPLIPGGLLAASHFNSLPTFLQSTQFLWLICVLLLFHLFYVSVHISPVVRSLFLASLSLILEGFPEARLLS